MFTGCFIDALKVYWTKLFWIDVILNKNKTSQGTSIIFFSFEVYQIPHMGKYFHVDHARRTCIMSAYPNKVTKSQRYAKSRDFQEKKNKWRWWPVVLAPSQQPQNAAVLKCSQARTSDTAIWASLIVAGPYFLALLPGACHLVSRCVAQQLETTLWICLVTLQW